MGFPTWAERHKGQDDSLETRSNEVEHDGTFKARQRGPRPFGTQDQTTRQNRYAKVQFPIHKIEHSPTLNAHDNR